MIREMRRRGFVQDIAAHPEVHPPTVSRALKRDGSSRGRRRLLRKSKLDPFKAHIDHFLAEAVWNATAIHRSLQADDAPDKIHQRIGDECGDDEMTWVGPRYLSDYSRNFLLSVALSWS